MLGLKLLDLEAGDQAEMAEIDGRYGVAMLQRSDPDQQVGEGDGHALGALLAVDLCGQQGRCFAVRNHFHVGQKICDIALVVLALNGVWRTIDSMSKLGESHGGERDSLVARGGDDSPEQLRYGFSLALGGDHYAGIQYQTHSISPMPEGSTALDDFGRPLPDRGRSCHRAEQKNRVPRLPR